MYKGIIKKQLPRLPAKNIFLEPERRDVGPAVMFAANKLKKTGYSGPLAIIWADHLMERVDEFIQALQSGEKLIKENPGRFVFMAERPRFANNNLGWLKVGKKAGEISGVDYFTFKGWKYKPAKNLCDKMYKSGDYFWNPGYFITSSGFLLKCFEKLAPKIYSAVIQDRYKNCPKFSFDAAVIEKINLRDAVVIKTNMGWSDPGTLYALKEALEGSSEANVEKGKIVSLDTSDSLIYNLEDKKIVAAVGLKGMVVVNTEDALVVVPKDEVVKISELVKEMKKKRMEKYL
jgi:mannose-1-phosphate guanylyltransferase